MFRRIKSHLDAYTGRAPELRDDAETMERIAEIVRWHQSGSYLKDPADALARIFVHLCQSETYSEEKAIPSPMSMEDMQAHLNAATDEVLRKPVPAHLYGERS